jgi:hypothetical protein
MIKHLFIAFTLLLTAPSHADIVSDQIEPISQFVIFNAPVVQVRRTSDQNVAEFYIKPSAHNLFQLSPNQFSRSIPPKVFDSSLFEALFGKGTVPAHLTWQGKNGEEGVSVNLNVNSLNKKQGTLKFNATLNSIVPSVLADKSRFAGKPIVFGKLKNAALFVVTQNARVIRSSGPAKSPNMVSNALRPMENIVINGCVIQPYTVCENANLRYANLYRADLRYANLYRADLRYAYLSYANLSHADLSYANLSYAELFDTNLNYANLNYANLSYAMSSFVGVPTFTNAILTNANLSFATLSYAILTGADLYKANLFRANLSRANLSSANLSSADLSGAILTGANLTGATGCSTTTPPLSGC